MICCDNLIHPFQYDPGVSQRQRVVDDLLSSQVQIDGRKMADLLQYISKLSSHVNYYDQALNVGDWQPFFSKSFPFLLARIIKYDIAAAEKKFNTYEELFRKKPNRRSLQLLTHFIYYQTIAPVNRWHKELTGSELPAEKLLEKLIRDKLQEPVKKFICFTNTAVQRHKISKIDFNKLQQNSAWELTSTDLRSAGCFSSQAATKRKRLIELKNEIAGLFPGFLNIISLSVSGAEVSMGQSLEPAKEEFRQKHSPHLALLFSFLKLFTYFQNDLNGYTKKHLDFFYKDVLKLTPRLATPDKAHVIFEIQNQLDKYLLKKNVQVKNGKDKNKAVINFALEDEIVVNKAQVAEIKTLFLNHESVFDPPSGLNKNYVEGVYIAPDATKADGIDIAFDESSPANWPTVGAKWSKYINPENKFNKPHPPARLGFILGSPVLLLNEGKRTIDIKLACKLNKDICGIDTPTSPNPDPCCEGQGSTSSTSPDPCKKTTQEELYLDENLLNEIEQKLNKEYYYISQDLIAKGIKKGIGKDLVSKLREFLLEPDPLPEKRLCYCIQKKYRYDIAIPAAEFEKDVVTGVGKFTAEELKILEDLFKPFRPLRVYFSGENEWIEPVLRPLPGDLQFFLTQSPVGSPNFMLIIKATIHADKPAITFYNKDNLKEDFDTTQPVVKVELDDRVKLILENDLVTALPALQPQPGVIDDCCLARTGNNEKHNISLYHFFRNVILAEEFNNRTTIDVSVCGLKKFVVQYDSTVMDINGPIYPFGPIPDIIDFNLDHTVANTVSEPTFPNPVPVPRPNLVGPSFYVGSKEVLLKNWKNICLKLNWKNKPVDFNDYYKAYLKRELPDPANPGGIITILGLNEADFQVNLALLEDGAWSKEQAASGKTSPNTITLDNNRRLFAKEVCATTCGADPNFTHTFNIQATDFQGSRKFVDFKEISEYKTDTRHGFIRFTLENQDFLHHDYAFALARQMMAMGKFPDKGVEGAIYYGTNGAVIVFKDTGSKIVSLQNKINDVVGEVGTTRNLIVHVSDKVTTARATNTLAISNAEFNSNPLAPGAPSIAVALPAARASAIAGVGKANLVITDLNNLKQNLSIFDFLTGKLKEDLSVPIPAEPWTPVIQNIEIDYDATAISKEIDLIHLYPYTGTYKHEEIEKNPPLFPTFCDEGTLFLGLKDLVPGSNLNILFQLAEATADSESEQEELSWYYLDNNEWKTLRKGFEVLDDATEEFTTSGIIKFVMPVNMTKENSILPKEHHWIRVSIPRNSKSVAEAIALHTQAVCTVFTNEEANDPLRLSEALPAGSISKLTDADPLVKTVTQPYDSFAGREPEAEKHFYVRVSELLRHKGRAIQKWDYERIVLEAFPQIYKVKCINHSYALDAKRFKIDFPMAPGYVILGVIPDLTKLKAGNSFEPKAPVSLLDDIEEYLRKKTSPFVRLRAMNPRYEKVDFCLKVKLHKGKDEVYYKKKLEDDIREFLAPWAIGEYSKISFGQCINRSDILRFIEGLDYVDYIIDLVMRHERDKIMNRLLQEICPRTPRSILLAGEIDICIKQNDCEEWEECYITGPNNQRVKVKCCANETKPIHEFCNPSTIQ